MRAIIKINTKALINNYQSLAKMAPKKEIIAVIKGDAYGHGIVEIAKVLSSLHCKFFAVATIEEAMLLRKNFIFSDIILFERTNEYRLLIRLNIVQSIVSLDHLKELINLKLPFKVELCIDTGLFRDGLNEEDFEKSLEMIKNSMLIVHGIYTHHSSKEQAKVEDKLFCKCLDKIKNKNILIHSSSSNNIIDDGNFNNCIRTGIALYGLDKEGTNCNLEPILSLYAPVIRCRKIFKGETVGYNEVGVAPKDGYIITIAIGYKDGLHRLNKILVYYNNNYLPQIGTMMMDHLMLFSENEIKENEMIELIGSHIRVDDLAKLYKTIPYEIVASLSPRIKKIYE